MLFHALKFDKSPLCHNTQAPSQFYLISRCFNLADQPDQDRSEAQLLIYTFVVQSSSSGTKPSMSSTRSAGKSGMLADRSHPTSSTSKMTAQQPTAHPHPTTPPSPQNSGHKPNPESPWDEGTVYGRLVECEQTMPTTTAVGSPYDRIPAYCVRAARTIDDFEKVFEGSPK